MLEQHLENLKLAAKDQLKASIEAAQARFRESVAAIELVERMLKENSPPSNGEGTTQLTEAVRQEVRRFTGEFDLRDVLDALKLNYPHLCVGLQNTSVSGALRRIAEDGEIQKLNRGKGRTPSRYRRTHVTIS